MQIIILGMHRSGTSLIARLVNMMGAYFGPEGSAIAPASDNPKGFWERQDVMEINDALLAASVCRWSNPLRFHPAAPPALSERMRRLVMGMDAFRPWMMKDPRLCITFPCWKPLLEAPVIVLAHRSPLECARSLEKRNGMAREWGLSLWEHHAAGAINAAVGLPHVHASHADFLAGPVAATARLHAALTEAGVQGLRLPSDREITAFVEPKLYRAREDESGAKLSAYQQELAAMMAGNAPLPASAIPVSAEAERALAYFAPNMPPT